MGSRVEDVKTSLTCLLLTVTLAGCGATTRQTTARQTQLKVTPQQVETTFVQHGVRLLDTKAYGDGDRPAIRAYVIQISSLGTSLRSALGTLTVYATVRDAVADEQGAAPTQTNFWRSNLIVVLHRGTSAAARRKVVGALNATIRSLR